MKDNKFTESSQCRLIKEKPCSIKSVDFFDENAGPVDDEREVSIFFYLDFSNTLDTLSHNTLIKKKEEW